MVATFGDFVTLHCDDIVTGFGNREGHHDLRAVLRGECLGGQAEGFGEGGLQGDVAPTGKQW